MNEEVGWRGFLLPRLQRRFSPLVAAVIVGVVWEVWHLPLILNGFYPGVILMFLVRMLFLIVLSIIYTWLYNRTGGSVLLMVLLHASFNNHSVVLPATAYAVIATVLVVGGLVVKDRMYRRIPNAAQEREGAPAV